MARSHARIAVGIWADPDWLDLPMHAQWMYLAIVSQGDINHAGVIALTPRRWSKLCADRDPDVIASALKILTDRRFLVVDEDEEQLLVRTFIRNDGVATQPNMLKTACRAILLVVSRPLRATLLGELLRIDQLRVEHMRTTPGTPPAIVVLRDTIDALGADQDPPPGDSRTTPSDGYGEGFREGFGVPIGEPSPRRRAGMGLGMGKYLPFRKKII